MGHLIQRIHFLRRQRRADDPAAHRAQRAIGTGRAAGGCRARQVAPGSESCRYMGHALLGRIECYAMRSARPPSR
ncbi:hypothetical protein EYC55_13010 [Xanthomonas oryzae]|nr:hypothetical protein EYC55_13010 [Xanthomonas oryzae]